MTSEWRPDLYARFARERAQPFHDLLALVHPRPAMRAVDLGCGTGELTRVVHDTLAASTTRGIDSSETMLAKSAAYLAPGLSFARAPIEAFTPDAPLDLVFSNAALHWVDDHPALLARLASFLAPGGQLVVQVPANERHLSHTAAAEVATEPPFRAALAGWTRISPVLEISEYARALHALGLVDVHVRRQVYPHVLDTRDAVADWTRSTLLTAYLTRLPRELHAPFEARYRELLRARLPDERPFFFPFERILFRAVRSE
ncbi:methyltransferase domain-containing protein [Sandaracinus amylolyticus]|uniref:methyltransferase domain-containing protein n=1 Tax=Sandaracinus amylolyticus TaxID=927083 RepID=UPI001F467067|nr:methyltransferase domain-containing protein [Sandaracinus amylolyticus]UJR81681.1 Trans-aconitate methyltransferase [Sandaracinus amylolyticus]